MSVYLPDELYRAAQDQGLSISALTQEAIVRELRRSRTDRWVARVRGRPARVHHEVDTSALMDDVRAGFDG